MAELNVYQLVTDRIIKQLESGVIPWHKPWNGAIDGAYNRISKKPYSLINQMILSHNGEYATFKQWNNIGGKIRKGAKSEIVVFWKIYQKEEVNEKGETVVINIPVLKYYNVFHISQVENVKPLNEPLTAVRQVPKADTLITDYITRENITYKETISNKAYYSPLTDTVVIPSRTQYKDTSEFYSTAFHELTHSTGHKKRLNRISTTEVAAFGSDDYSKEELTAEIGSCNLLNILGIETPKSFKNSAAYIQSWLRVLKNDNRFIVSASSKADKAVKYILNET